MNSDIMTTKSLPLYDIDYQRWLAQTVAQLKARDFGNLDVENLIEEIESLGKSDRRSLASYLMRLCEHLLKLQYWESERETCFRGWALEIRNFRLQIQRIINDSPSLKNYLQDIFMAEYQNGRKLFLDGSGTGSGDDSGFAPAQIPQAPAFSLEQALDEDWLPWCPA